MTAKRARKSKSFAVAAPTQPQMQAASPLGVTAPLFGCNEYDAASLTSREMARWRPSARPVDIVVNGAKLVADARSRDSSRNMAIVHGAGNTHKDSIVGSQYRLTAQPVRSVLNGLFPRRGEVFDEVWEEEFQQVVEDRFNLSADSNANWFDRMGVNTLTSLVRLAIGGFLLSGEVLATAEWDDKTPGRPFNTCLQMVSPDRLSNPRWTLDTPTLRRGVERDAGGRAISYWIQQGSPFMLASPEIQWVNVSAAKPWGRKQVIHIIEQHQPDQTRGMSELVSTLKTLRMMKKFNETTLQSAVLGATYAAAIESELPQEVVAAALGTMPQGNGMSSVLGLYGQYLNTLGSFVDGATNLNIDGAKIPHLFPGTKLNIKPVGTPGGVGTDFEVSLMRHVCTALGISYEEFSRDYSKTNYSSLRGTLAQTGKFMTARKKHVADRFASDLYQLWFEEEMSDGNIPLPAGVGRSVFYKPLAKEALTSCDWIGAGFGQVDEMRETQAALMRVGGGLSTLERECGRLGLDYRKVLKQQAREKKMLTDLNLVLTFDATRPALTANDLIAGAEKDTGPASQTGNQKG